MIEEQIYKDERVSRIEDRRPSGFGLVAVLKPGCIVLNRPVQAVHGRDWKELRRNLQSVSVNPVLQDIQSLYAGRPVE